jgi:hypothetical protein
MCPYCGNDICARSDEQSRPGEDLGRAPRRGAVRRSMPRRGGGGSERVRAGGGSAWSGAPSVSGRGTVSWKAGCERAVCEIGAATSGSTWVPRDAAATVAAIGDGADPLAPADGRPCAEAGDELPGGRSGSLVGRQSAVLAHVREN